MAYDGNDEDGYQSSLHQAEEGLKAFADNGADISKINIGIAAYARPINSTPYWASWCSVHAVTKRWTIRIQLPADLKTHFTDMLRIGK